MEWYNRDREFSYGDYNNQTKKYYNEDSNKWVSWLDKKQIIEKYIRYEFSCFDDKEIEKHFGWSNIDRVGKYIFLIYKKTVQINKMYGKDYVYLEKVNDEQRLLGYNNYKSVIEKLKQLKIIKVKIGRKVYDKSIRLYKLNDDFLDCDKRIVFIRNSKVIKLLDERYKTISDDEFIQWEIDSCKKLNIEDSESGVGRLISQRIRQKLIENEEKLKWDFIGKREKAKLQKGWDDKKKTEYILQCYRNFEILKSDILSLKEGGITTDMFTYDDYGGRLYNILNNKEKEFRNLLKLGVNKLIEVDMINGYVSLLCRVFKGITQLQKGDNPFDDKIKEIVGDENGDDFLQMYEDICFGEGKRIDFYNYVGIKSFGIRGMTKEYRDYIKQLTLYIINGKDDFSKDKKFIDNKYSYNEIGERIFGKGGWRCMEKLKNTSIDFKVGKTNYGYSQFKNMSKILSFMEVIVMKDIWRKLIKNKINYISLFDGVLVSSVDRNLVMELVNKNKGINSCIRFKIDDK